MVNLKRDFDLQTTKAYNMAMNEENSDIVGLLKLMYHIEAMKFENELDQLLVEYDIAPYF